jgi:hypothetical protein
VADGTSARGAKPIRSYWSRTVCGRFRTFPEEAARRVLPGLPGINSSASRRMAGLSAGIQETAMSIGRPPESAQSIGPFSEAHC